MNITGLDKEGERTELLRAYREYLKLAGDAAFIDVARSTDAACCDQPWESLKTLIDAFGVPRVIQIWTKGPRGLLQKGAELLEYCRAKGAVIVCQLTVNGYGPTVEPRVPWPIDWAGIDGMIDFLKTPQAILWRYDPVIPGIADLGVLEGLAQAFGQRGVTRGTYNWAELGWFFVRERLGRLYDRIDFQLDKDLFSQEIERIGSRYGISFMILAEAEGLAASLNAVSRGSWQYEWLTEVGDGFPPRDFLPGARRGGCMCAPSFDIGFEGQFGKCHGCVYCFAP